MVKENKGFITNKKATFNYFILERYEAGVALKGSEIKSIRAGRANFTDAYVRVQNGEAYLVSMHISPYAAAADQLYDPKRSRKLLLHKREIVKLTGQMGQKGYTVVPLKLYFKKGKAKIEIGIAKGKRKYDKRESIKKKEHQREIERGMRRR